MAIHTPGDSSVWSISYVTKTDSYPTRGIKRGDTFAVRIVDVIGNATYFAAVSCGLDRSRDYQGPELYTQLESVELRDDVVRGSFHSFRAHFQFIRRAVVQCCERHGSAQINVQEVLIRGFISRANGPFGVQLLLLLLLPVQARHGKKKRLEETLNTGFDINAEDSLGNTLLLAAVQQIQVQTLPTNAHAVLCAAHRLHIIDSASFTATSPHILLYSFAMPEFRCTYFLPSTQ